MENDNVKKNSTTPPQIQNFNYGFSHKEWFFELCTQGLELYTQGLELFTQGFKQCTQGLHQIYKEVLTLNPRSNISPQ